MDIPSLLGGKLRETSESWTKRIQQCPRVAMRAEGATTSTNSHFDGGDNLKCANGVSSYDRSLSTR